MSGQGSPEARRIDRLSASELPACLGELSRPVAGLWYMGDRSALDPAPHGLVAIVGTREASPYGIRVAERLATACARSGLVVVSGMARGIDAAAHRAAMAAGGLTIGVQGTGVDVPYPASHRALHGAVCQHGLVVSELEPGSPAGPGCFPRRNRIIAALAQVTVVVEAGFKSGAINTATHALELGRVVAAVPGRIDDERARGSNGLIRDGAQVVADVDDLLILFQLSTPPGLSESGRDGVLSRPHGPRQDTALIGSAPARLESPEVLDGSEHDTPFRLYAQRALSEDLEGERWTRL